MHVLRSCHEDTRGNLLDDKGRIRLGGSCKPLWSELVAKAPGFFAGRHTDLHGAKRSNFGSYVTNELQKALRNYSAFAQLLFGISACAVVALSTKGVS